MVPCIRQMHCQEWGSIPRVCPCKTSYAAHIELAVKRNTKAYVREEWPPALPPSDSSNIIPSIPSDLVKNTLDS